MLQSVGGELGEGVDNNSPSPMRLGEHVQYCLTVVERGVGLCSVVFTTQAALCHIGR